MERYSAKGFVSKPDKNKGAQKQELWTECIQELAERSTFDKHTRNVLERIATQSNVPRKKPKFVNFLKSSMRFSPMQADKIWTIIEEGLEEFKKKSLPSTTQPTANAESPTPAANENESEQNGKTEENVTEATDSSNAISNGITLESVIENSLAKSDVAKNTKKALKRLQKMADIPLNVKSPKKKKLVKFLQEQLKFDVDTSNAVWECLSQSIETLSPAAKKVSNGLNSNESKKRKNSNESEVDCKKAKTEVSLADSTTDANGESTFDWQKCILRIFNKNQANNQIPVNSLKSKVIKKFLRTIGENETNSTQYDKKFKKYLKKINTLTLANGMVQLKA